MSRDLPPPFPSRSTVSRVLVIGIGNAYHGDDAAGLEIARRVRDACLGGVMVEECSEDMVELLDAWQDSDVVVLIDAVQSGSPLGTIFRFDALAEVLPSCFVRQVSSHGIGMPESIELARALDRLPRNLIVYGVEGALFELGAALSPEVEAVLDTAADRIVGELRSSEQPPEASGAA